MTDFITQLENYTFCSPALSPSTELLLLSRMEDPQQKQKEKKPKRASPQLVCVVACLYIAIPLVAYATYYMQTVPFISCSKHQQLVRKTPRFMPAETFAEMKKCFEDHPLTGSSMFPIVLHTRHARSGTNTG